MISPASAQTGPLVWVMPSLQRVGPTDPAGTGTQAQIAAARGEYESFQIAVRAPSSNGLTNVNVTVSDLSGPGGASIPKTNLTLYREQYVNVTTNSPAWNGSANMPLPPGWYPDGLIPFVDPNTGAPLSGAMLTAVPFNVNPSYNQPIWVDVVVPRAAAAGQYNGTFTVTSNQGQVTGQIVLTVWNFTLPLTPYLHSSFLFWQAGTTYANAELLRNRTQPTSVANSDESLLMSNYGLRDYNLGYWSGANIQTCTMSLAPSVSQIQAAVSAQQPGLSLYNYSADEIGSCTNLYTSVQQWGYNLHQAGVKQLITMAPVPQLFDDGSGSGRSAVDVWGVLPVMYDNNVSNTQYALQKGDQVWSYNTLVQDSYSPKWEIDFAPINFRIQSGIINQSLNLTGVLYWRVDLWSADPWNNVYGYPGSYPGEGVLVYPGSTVGIQGVAPSMRLKWLRDGADDYDYIQLLKQAGYGAWALQVAAGAGANWNNWTRDPNVLYSARQQLGQQLDALGGGPSPSVPTAPSNPSPANGATGVSVTPTLSWSGSSNATSYDAYFGTSSTPPLAGNTTTTTYNPGTLNSTTTYYWRVVAKNSSGSASSSTWLFTTLQVVVAPAAPTNPSPAPDATGVSLTPALSWSASSGATSYDVYFGTTSTTPLVGNTTTTTYSPGSLAAGTMYYWRVVAKNSAGTASSPTWSFTTAATTAIGPVSVSPSSSSGTGRTFQFTYSDSQGYTDLAGATVLINSTLTWTNSCWVYYDRIANLIWLSSDDTTTWTNATPGTSAILQNSQCVVAVSGASVTAAGATLVLNLALTFKATSPGTKIIYMSSNTVAGASTSYSALGTWTVPAFGPVSVTPVSGTGSTGTFRLLYSDSAGYTDLAGGTLLINSSLAWTNACWVYYDRGSNRIWLASNDTTTWASAVAGSNKKLQNSQCSINVGASSASGSGNSLAVKLAIGFSSSFAGTKTMYLSSKSANGTSTSPQPFGIWSVP